MKKLAVFLVIILMASCEKMEDSNYERLAYLSDIIGTWVESGYEETIAVMKKAGSLDPEKYGFILKSDGTFTERKNSGWCATPPISYENYDGRWVAVSDSLLEITVGFWGGTMKYFMHVVSVDEEYLRIRYEYEMGD